MKTLFGILALSMIAQHGLAANLDEAMNYDQSHPAGNVVGTYDTVEATPYKLTYKFRELRLHPNEMIYLKLPADVIGKNLELVQITHKQQAGHERGCVPYRTDWDCVPAYTSVEFLDANHRVDGDMWRYWGGVGSGPFNSKFAEIRQDEGETDNLYEWIRHGNLGIASGQRDISHAALPISGIRVRSLGTDTTVLQKIIIKINPPKSSDLQDVIFARGFEFGDYETATGRRYPGNASVGNYGTALEMNDYHNGVPAPATMPANWAFDGRIRIPLDANKVFQSLDIACGDMKPVPPGATAAEIEKLRGNGKVTLTYVHADGQREVLMERENVGTSGVMRGLASGNKKLDRGGYLEVEAPQGNVKVMGVRVAYVSK
jgi:hypothetical protein